MRFPFIAILILVGYTACGGPSRITFPELENKQDENQNGDQNISASSGEDCQRGDCPDDENDAGEKEDDEMTYEEFCQQFPKVCSGEQFCIDNPDTCNDPEFCQQAPDLCRR